MSPTRTLNRIDAGDGWLSFYLTAELAWSVIIRKSIVAQFELNSLPVCGELLILAKSATRHTRPLGVVVAKPGQDVSEDDTKLWLPEVRGQERPSKYGVPGRIVFVDALPKTSVGKFDKKLLRSQLAQEVVLGGDSDSGTSPE